MNEQHKTTVAICDTQPITAEGMKNLLAAVADLEFAGVTGTLEAAMSSIESGRSSGESAGDSTGRAPAGIRTPDIMILDKGFGMRAVLDWIHDLKLADATPAVMVWGVSMTEAEALRLLQAGARGIIRKTSDLTNLLACLRTVAAGRTWMEDCVFRDSVRAAGYPRSELTAREHQVLELVEQGFKNKEIALELGIRPGTVKIHLKHIFEKTGVRGRYGLAISGLKEKGLVSLAS